MVETRKTVALVVVVLAAMMGACGVEAWREFMVLGLSMTIR